MMYGELPQTLEETPGESYQIHCPQCHGKGCFACADSGVFELDCSPIEFCKGVWPLLKIADMWRKGTMYAAGGQLDQPAALMDAVHFIWADEDHMRQERLGPALAMLT